MCSYLAVPNFFLVPFAGSGAVILNPPRNRKTWRLKAYRTRILRGFATVVSRVVTCCTYFFLMTYDVILYINTSECWKGDICCFFFPFFAWFRVIRPSLEGLFSPLGSGYTYKYPMQLSMPGHQRCLPTSYPPDSESRGLEGKNTFITCEFLQNNM